MERNCFSKECHFHPAGCNIPGIFVERVKIREQLETVMVNRYCGDKSAGKSSQRERKVDVLIELDKKNSTGFLKPQNQDTVSTVQGHLRSA